MASFKKNGMADGGGSEWDESEHPRDEQGRFVAVSEFRYLESHDDPKIQGHPAHLYAQSGEDAKFIQLTHSAQIKGATAPNIEMTQNPNPKDKRAAYFVPKSHTGKLDTLGKPKKSWAPLSAEDDEKMKPFRDPPFDK